MLPPVDALGPCVSLSFPECWPDGREPRKASPSLQNIEKTASAWSRGRRTVFVHVNWIWPSRLCLRVGVNLARTKFADIFSPRTGVSRTSKTELLVFFGLCFVEKFLVPLETLRGGSANKRSNCPPLGGHELCKVEELLVFGL